MKKHATIPAMALFVLASCTGGNQNNASEKLDTIQTSAQLKSTQPNIPYKVGKNYFVKNTVPDGPLPSIKFSSVETFESVFGAAATMGKDGTPTSIDFDKQYVIAVVANTTDTLTGIEPISLQKNSQDEVIFTYTVVKGEKQSFSIRPNLFIVVDKAYDGNVILKEEEQ